MNILGKCNGIYDASVYESMNDWNRIVLDAECRDGILNDAEITILTEIAEGMVSDADLKGDDYWEARRRRDEIGDYRPGEDLPSVMCLDTIPM